MYPFWYNGLFALVLGLVNWIFVGCLIFFLIVAGIIVWISLLVTLG